MIKSHIEGTLETVKFAEKRVKYWENLTKMLELGHKKEDLIHYFPAFAGELTLNRYFTLYELYKKTLGIAGHCAEIGVFRGASSILFAKLVNMFEPQSLTMCHGFDNFQGIGDETDSPLQVVGGDSSDENQLRELIRLQGLDNVLKIHRCDILHDLPAFFEKYPHLRFKLVFLDSGTYQITKKSLEYFWPRLNRGGILILDQFCSEVAPGETRAVCELLPAARILSLKNSWMPSAYIIKD